LAPIESIVQMKGLLSSPNPAITGWHKNGPNLKSKNLVLSSGNATLIIRNQIVKRKLETNNKLREEDISPTFSHKE